MKIKSPKIPEDLQYYRRGLDLEKSARYADATDAYAEAIRLNNGEARWHYRHAGVLEKCARWEDAADAYAEAIRLNDGEALWHYRLGSLLSNQQGKLTDSLAYLSSAIELRPKEPSWIAEHNYVQHLLEKGEQSTVNKTRPKQWYNIVYKHSIEYRRSFQESNYWPTWKKIIELIRQIKPNKILDIGCGSGQLALAIKAHIDLVEYVGIDFSSEAISIARLNVPDFTFYIGDVLTHEIITDSSYDLMICTEVLEHIEDDLKLLSRIKKDTKIIATVPDFNSLSHIRFFNEQKDVEERYGNQLNKLLIEIVRFKKNKIYILVGDKT